jgi:hypothetical protein
LLAARALHSRSRLRTCTLRLPPVCP